MLSKLRIFRIEKFVYIYITIIYTYQTIVKLDKCFQGSLIDSSELTIKSFTDFFINLIDEDIFEDALTK